MGARSGNRVALGSGSARMRPARGVLSSRADPVGLTARGYAGRSEPGEVFIKSRQIGHLSQG